LNPGRDDRHAGVLYENLTHIAATDHYGGQTSGCVTESADRTFHDGLHGERCERRFLRRLPDHRVTADESKRGVPGLYRHGKVERGYHATDTERVPSLHHPVIDPLGRDGAAVELAR
jgi:hypothetical protein